MTEQKIVSRIVKILLKKEKSLVIRIFSYSLNVFKSLLLQGREIFGLWDENIYQSIQRITQALLVTLSLPNKLIIVLLAKNTLPLQDEETV